MKELITDNTGGHPATLNDLRLIQSEVYAALNSIFANRGSYVMSGCLVTEAGANTVNISPGIVYLNSKFMRFDGANNVELDEEDPYAIMVGPSADSSPRVYGNGVAKNRHREVKAVVQRYSAAPGHSISIQKPFLYGIPRLLATQLDIAYVQGYLVSEYNEPWKRIGDTGQIPFLNGWTHHPAADIQKVEFRKDLMGQVHVRGTASGENATGGTIIQLPSGYRPDKTSLYTVAEGDFQFSNIVVDSAGNVFIQTGDLSGFYNLDFSFFPSGF